MSKCKPVHYDVAEPEGREDMPTPFGWHEAVVPSEEPARSYQTKTEPAPPWKPPLRPGSHSASGVSNRDAVKRQRAGDAKQQCYKRAALERWVRHELRTRGKAQVAQEGVSRRREPEQRRRPDDCGSKH